MLGKAIGIVSNVFANKKDKGGEPYILHCLRVMNSVRHLGHDVMCAAVLHDLVEDTLWDNQMLINFGFSNDIVTWVDLLTHKRTDSYDDYIKKLSFSRVATKIKMADLRDNSDITRLKGLTKKDHERIEKYFKAYEYLKKT